jgi:DnaJ family protein C protein 7
MSTAAGPDSMNDVDMTSPSSPAAQPSSPAQNYATSPFGQTEGPPVPPHRVPTSPPPEDKTQLAEGFKTSGNNFFKAKNFDKAVEEYSKAIDADPSNATYYSNRAAAYMGSNKYYDALEDIKRADTMDSGNPKFLLRLARIYTSLGRPKEAIDVYNMIQPAVSTKDQAPAINMLQFLTQAEASLQEGTAGSMIIYALDQAAKGLGSGIDTPRRWKLMRAEAYLKMGNLNALGEAQNSVISLLRSDPSDPEALTLRGRIFYAQGDNDRALTHFRQAVSSDPDCKAAIQCYRMVQKLDKLKAEGNDFFKSGKIKDAVDKYTQALQIDTSNKLTNAKILQNRALCYIKV